jgi:hypothetical protein
MNDSQNNNFGADFRHPHAPPMGARLVFCRVCSGEYPSSQMKWDGEDCEWRCKYWPHCDGTGYRLDIVDCEYGCACEQFEDDDFPQGDDQ